MNVGRYSMGALTLGLVLAACQTVPPQPVAQAKIGASASPGASPTTTVLDPTVKPPSHAPTLLPGSGKMVADAVSPPPGPIADASATGAELAFADTEIAQVVGAVLGEALGLNYSVDPAIKGTMTLQSSRPLSHDQLLPALEDALRLQGIAIVEANGTYRVLPSKDASRFAAGLRRPGAEVRPGYAVQIVPLQFIGAKEMQKILEPFANATAILRVDEGRNLLVLAGTSQELANLLDVVHTFDVDWLAGMSFALFPATYVDAKTLASELGEVFSDPRSPLNGVVRLVPIARLNAVMVITPQPRYLADVESWIKRLDLGGSSPGRRIYVYDVQNGKADELARSLAQILSVGGGASEYGGPGYPTAASYPSGAAYPGSVLPTAGALGGPPAGSTFGGSGTMLGSGPSRFGQTVPAGQTALTNTNPTALDTGALRIVPNDASNSLLILATPSEFSVIEGALARLDTAPRQVIIEASLAEVTLTDDLKFGLQWSYQSKNGPATLSNASNGGVNSSFPGFSFLYTGKTDIAAVLNSLETRTQVHVLSSPKLLVLSNHEAILQVGDQVPIITQTAVSTTTAGAPVVNSVQMQDTGVILRITPRVNKNGLVLMDISQEVSDVSATTTSNIDSPTISQRKITSTIAVNSGETVALGGLIRDDKSTTRGGLPLLSRIPVLGSLFGTTDHSTTRVELIVLLTPRVLRDSEETKTAMDEIRGQFKQVERDLKNAAKH